MVVATARLVHPIQLLSNQRPLSGDTLFWKNFLSLIFSSEHLDASTVESLSGHKPIYEFQLLATGKGIWSSSDQWEKLMKNLPGETESWVVWCVSEAAGSREGDCNVSLEAWSRYGSSRAKISGSGWTSSEPQSNCVWSQICSKTFQDIRFSSLSQFRRISASRIFLMLHVIWWFTVLLRLIWLNNNILSYYSLIIMQG